MKWSHALDLHENREHASHEGGWEIIRTSNLERGHVKGLTDHTISHKKCPLAGSATQYIAWWFYLSWHDGGGAGRGDAGADTITEPHDCVLVFSNRDIDVHSIQRNHNQDTIYYKWASVKMTLKFHFLWSTLFWLEESVSAVYSDWLRGKSEANSCSWSAAEVWRQHQELLDLICTPGVTQ